MRTVYQTYFFYKMISNFLQSFGLLVSVAVDNRDHSWGISAVITVFQQLFGGFLSTTLPPAMGWARYLSMVYYAYSNLCILEFEFGDPIRLEKYIFYRKNVFLFPWKKRIFSFVFSNNDDLVIFRIGHAITEINLTTKKRQFIFTIIQIVLLS